MKLIVKTVGIFFLLATLVMAATPSITLEELQQIASQLKEISGKITQIEERPLERNNNFSEKLGSIINAKLTLSSLAQEIEAIRNNENIMVHQVIKDYVLGLKERLDELLARYN